MVMFFEEMKKKIRKNNIILFAIDLVFLCGCAAGIVFTG